MDPQRHPAEHRRDGFRIGQHVEEVAARREQDVELAAAGRVDHGRSRQARLGGHLEAPPLRQDRGVVGVHLRPAGERGRVAAHLRPALHPGVTADRHQPAALAPYPAARQGQVDDRADVVLAALVLGDAHAPDEDSVAGSREERGELRDPLARRAGDRLELLPACLGGHAPDPVEPLGVGTDELLVDPSGLDQVLERADEETDVAAGIDGEELVGDLRPEQCALRLRWDPVVLHARLAERVDDHHPGPRLLGDVEVLHRHRLVVGGVGADEDDHVGADPVRVGAGRGTDAERVLEREGARRVTDPGGVVDRVRADRPDRLLGGVVALVRHPAAGQEEAAAVGAGGADPLGGVVERLLPVDRREPGLAVPAEHRLRQPAEAAELGAGE